METTVSKTSWSQKIVRGLVHFAHGLVEPSKKITDVAQRRRVRLLSIFMLCLTGLFLIVTLSYVFTVPDYKIPFMDLVGYGLLLGTYLISRTRFTLVAVALLLFMFPMNVFGNVMDGTFINLAATLSFLIPSFVLASIFLNAWGVTIYGIGVNLLILLLPVIAPKFVPNFSLILGPFSAGMIVVALSVIAIVNRNQIERDRQAELRKAYDSTLEGWSHALEIRDKGTEGHSNRVTELTLRLARVCGVRNEDLESVYRGSLLHDIGKMAIPDAILTKSTELDEEEWKVMRTHPKIARDMLSKITFLQQALIIPTFHHEWWDGSGYPAGLKGEQIPLAARIFAVVDVWDALLSDRPYRKAWSKEKTIEYIKEKRGKQFDPNIVDLFFALKP
jgi:putative nucleotidyltransferase with HDIG domain